MCQHTLSSWRLHEDEPTHWWLSVKLGNGHLIGRHSPGNSFWAELMASSSGHRIPMTWNTGFCSRTRTEYPKVSPGTGAGKGVKLYFWLKMSVLLCYIKFTIFFVNNKKLPFHLSLLPYIRPVFDISIYGNRLDFLHLLAFCLVMGTRGGERLSQILFRRSWKE